MAVQTNQNGSGFQTNIRNPKNSQQIHIEYEENLLINPSYDFEYESSDHKENLNILQQDLADIQSPSCKTLKIMILGQSHFEKENFVNSLCYDHMKKYEGNSKTSNLPKNSA